MLTLPPTRRSLCFSAAAWILLIPATLLAADSAAPADAAAASPAGEQSHTALSEAREAFIQNFRRIGLNTAPGDAMLLRILVESSGCKRGVEVGAATGYGAINMGLAFERNGGQLVTIDIDPQMVATTRDNLQEMRLQDTVTVIEGNALEVLPKLEGQYDFLFLDAVKRDYLAYFRAMEPKMKPGSLIVGDNVIRSAGQMRDFLEYIQQSPDYHTVIVRASEEKNDGMSISYKLR